MADLNMNNPPIKMEFTQYKAAGPGAIYRDARIERDRLDKKNYQDKKNRINLERERKRRLMQKTNDV